MKNRIVEVPAIKNPITKSPGFVKKKLSEYKLDVMALCGFGCHYCSSNTGNYLRINRRPFAAAAEEQLGAAAYPTAHPELAMIWPDVLDRMQAQLDRKRPGFGRGKTLVFSMLTDGFSPVNVTSGVTEAALRMVLDQTEFRVRVLTKNAIVGSDKWIQFFLNHPGRFVVGLSTGTMDDEWAQRVEIGTSTPTARLRALRRLQDADVPTFGMLCPVFPDMLEGDGLEHLVAAIRPERCENVWAEPYNDRFNWHSVRDGYPESSSGREWMDRAFDGSRSESDPVWSQYANELYMRLSKHAEANGWVGKLRYLLYEDQIVADDAVGFGGAGFEGVLLQSKPGEDGLSRNPHVAAVQQHRVCPDRAQFVDAWGAGAWTKPVGTRGEMAMHGTHTRVQIPEEDA